MLLCTAARDALAARRRSLGLHRMLLRTAARDAARHRPHRWTPSVCVYRNVHGAISVAGAMQLPSSVAERGKAHGQRTHVRFVVDLDQPLT